MMKPMCFAASAAAISLMTPVASEASDKGWSNASTVARDILIGAALAAPAVQQDWNGDLQAGASIVAAGGLAYGLKHVFPEQRPDHSDRRSFPSAHSAEAFAAVAMLENRYGWKAGLPALAAASFVAIARVEARKHHWYDCLAGTAIGSASGLLISTKRDERVQLLPWADSGGGGMSLAMRF